MEEAPPAKRKTIEPTYPPKDKRNDNAAKVDSILEIDEVKTNSKLNNELNIERAALKFVSVSRK